MKRQKPNPSDRLHRAYSVAANTMHWWNKGYSLRTAWHLAKIGEAHH